MVLPSCTLSFVPPGPQQRFLRHAEFHTSPSLGIFVFCSFQGRCAAWEERYKHTCVPWDGTDCLGDSLWITFPLTSDCCHHKRSLCKKKKTTLFYTLFYIDIKPKLSFVMYRRWQLVLLKTKNNWRCNKLRLGLPDAICMRMKVPTPPSLMHGNGVFT